MNHEDTQTNAEESILFSHGAQIEEDLPLTQELINLSDQFSEFICVNAFVSESLAALLSEQDTSSPETVRGARYCVDAIQSRSTNLKEALNHYCQRHLAEAHVQLPSHDD